MIAARLADQLEVTVRTVYRDIVTLQALGAPVEGEAGVGYVLRPGFLLPPLMFKGDELEAMVLGARWVIDRTDAELRRAARSAMARIVAVLPARLRTEAESTPLIVGPGGAPRVRDTELIKLRRAIRQQRKVGLRYRSLSGEVTERVRLARGRRGSRPGADPARLRLRVCCPRPGRPYHPGFPSRAGLADCRASPRSARWSTMRRGKARSHGGRPPLPSPA